MSRPRKLKKLGCLPKKCLFGPKDNLSETSYVLTLEQYETIRLIDQMKYQQVDAAKTMGVARTTVQKLYKEARTIIANALIEGAYIHIKGESTMKENCCQDHEHQATKLLIAAEKDQVAIDYQHAERFELFTLENNAISRQDTILPDAQGGCRRFILSLGVEHLVTGSMHQHHFERYQDSHIKVYYGRNLSVKDALGQFLNGQLPSIKDHLTDSVDHTHDNEGCCGGKHHQHSHDHDKEGCCGGKHHHE